MSPTPAHAPRAAVRDVALQIGGRLLNLALGVVVTALLVRGLGEAGFGRWATILVIVQVADYFTSFGLEGVTIRLAAAEEDPARREQRVDALVSLRMALTLPAMIAAIGVMLLVEDDPQMRTAGVLLSLTLLLSAPTMVRARFQLRMRNDVPVTVMTINSVLWGIAVVLLYQADAGIVAFAAAFAVIGLVTSIIMVLWSLRLAPLRLAAGRELWGDLVRIGVPIGIGGLLILTYARLDQVLVFALAGERDAGLYGAVYRILEQSHFVPVSIMATLAPLTAAAATVDPARLRRLVTVAAQLLTLASLGGLAVALALSRPIVVFLFGEEFAPAAPALPILAGAFVAISFGYLTGNLMLVFGLQKRFMTIAAAALAVNVVLNVLLIPPYGFLAAAWVTLATELVVVGPTLVIVTRKLGGPLPGRPLLRVAAAAAGLALALEALDRAGAPLWACLVAAVPIYGGLCLATRAISPDQLRALRSARRETRAAAPPPATPG